MLKIAILGDAGYATVKPIKIGLRHPAADIIPKLNLLTSGGHCMVLIPKD